jgi:UPF0716 family protein affecting phage T7 exclusion
MTSVERRDAEPPSERIYAPRPSWAPAVFAFAAALTICGAFISFMVPGWIYSIVGAVVLLGALRAMTRGSVRTYFRLPRRQRVRGAVLPVETIKFPPS